MKKLLLSLMLASITLTTVKAQQVQIPDVRKNEFRGVQSIKDKGYYTYYVNEKLKKGMSEFMIEIYDMDLKLVRKTPIEITKDSYLAGGEFNGKDFLFAFYDLKKKQNSMVTIDSDGKVIKKEIRQAKKYATAGTLEIYPGFEGDGFYLTESVKEKKWGYRVEKLDRNLKSVWEKTVSNAKGYVAIEAAEAGNGKIALVSVERPTALSKKAFGKLVCFNGNNGNIDFEYPLFDGTITGIPSSFKFDKDANLITAGMYFDGSKWDDTNSDGVFLLKLSSTGQKLMFNSIDWDKGIQSAMKATSRKFSIGTKPKVLFHEIIESETGYQLIGETFRQTVKAGTMLAMAGGAKPSELPVGFTVMDFVIFNYDKNGLPLDINKIEKPYKSITVSAEVGQKGGVKLAYYMKQYNMFTYNYATTTASNEPAIVYTNFESTGLTSGKPYIGISTIGMGKESQTQKLPISSYLGKVSGSDASDEKIGALLSRPGYVCTYFYDKKTKTINIKMETMTLL